MIPIEKNIIVTDEQGKPIGTTYPKRAMGLVKNGRAEYVNDREIRLKDTRIPTVSNITEELNMSKTINFSARDFKLEDTCQTNVGVRGFMTVCGESTEVWEIGDWGWNWTSLRSEIRGLEKNTDYIFRFAMTGGHTDDDREVSMVHIHHLAGSVPEDPEEQNRAWEERYTYQIGKSRFEPVISKRDKTGMLRIFEIPFNTGEYENWCVVIVAQHAVARFFTAKENASYRELEDLTFEQWREERTEQLRAERVREARAFANMDWQSGDDDNDSFQDMQSARNDASSEAIPNFFGGRIDLSEAEIHSAKMLRELMAMAKRGVHVDLSGAILDCDEDED